MSAIRAGNVNTTWKYSTGSRSFLRACIQSRAAFANVSRTIGVPLSHPDTSGNAGYGTSCRRCARGHTWCRPPRGRQVLRFGRPQSQTSPSTEEGSDVLRVAVDTQHYGRGRYPRPPALAGTWAGTWAGISRRQPPVAPVDQAGSSHPGSFWSPPWCKQSLFPAWRARAEPGSP